MASAEVVAAIGHRAVAGRSVQMTISPEPVTSVPRRLAIATTGRTLQANVLLGGSSDTISLQPVSIEGGTGLNIAGGFASMA